MGKGDQKTRRGKLFSGSYGVLRPRKKARAFSVITTTKKTTIKPEISKASPKPPAAHKPKSEPVAEEVKDVAEEVKPEKKEVKKPAAKKETAKKEPAKKEPAKKDPKK